MHHFARLARLKLTDLPPHHRLALAAGAGAVLSADDERLSAADELVAVALPPLVRLRAVALLADARQALNDELAAELARAAAAVLRLVDAALSAHGRQHGYLTAAWLDRALLFGSLHDLVPATREPMPVPDRAPGRRSRRGALERGDRAAPRPPRRARGPRRRAQRSPRDLPQRNRRLTRQRGRPARPASTHGGAEVDRGCCAVATPGLGRWGRESDTTAPPGEPASPALRAGLRPLADATGLPDGPSLTFGLRPTARRR
jgi:hypothetical protein